ncbi:MAG: right-handed parallel beta-helix repeat-containing protein [Phycisphaerae bacterium]|nr:right-handed parallel beta-helix repeat-containing protein [Phycisphaerae bacterium]
MSDHKFHPLEPRRLLTTFIVSPTGSDAASGTLAQPLLTIQRALNLATQPGDIVEVRSGTYAEHLTIDQSGSKNGYITLENYPGEHVLLTGTNAAPPADTTFGDCMIEIVNQSWVQISGLEIANENGTALESDAFGIRVQGSGSHIVIKNNTIHDIDGEVTHRSGDNVTGYAGAGIQVYGSSTKKAYSDITIKGNQIYDCEPGDNETETVTLNGNINGFLISHNRVHDDNNIGIDMIGGEADTFGLPAGTLNLPVTRNGRCVGNRVYNIHATYGGGFAGGIYVDGGQNILIDRNVSDQNDMGLEIGAENAGYTASNVNVENNILYNNTQAGLAIGGYASDTGRVKSCRVINNTIVNNDTTNTGSGQLLIQYASRNTITNNLFVAEGAVTLIGSDGAGNSGNILDNNLYDAPPLVSSPFAWNDQTFATLAEYQSATGEDGHSLYANPRFTNASSGDFTLSPNSPAIRRGSAKPGRYAVLNFVGAMRSLPPNIGAY